MKNMHDSRFDDELKNRLGDYTEEPDDALWQGIAAGISSTPAGMGWLGWVAKSVVASVVVMSVVGDVSVSVSSFRFQVSGTEVSVLEDSKFKIQDLKVNADEVDFYAEELMGNVGRVHSPRSAVDGNAEECIEHVGATPPPTDRNAVVRDDGLNDRGSTHNARGLKLNTGVGRSEFKDQRSKLAAQSATTDAQGSKVKGSAMLEVRDSKPSAGKGKTETKDQGSKPEERNSGFETQTAMLDASSSTVEGEGPKDERSVDGMTRRESKGESDSKNNVTTANTGLKSVGTTAVGSGEVPAGNSKSKIRDSKSEIAERDSSGKDDSGVGGIEDAGIVNFAGPPRPVNGDAVVEEKPLKVDSVQVAKVEKEKVREVREEKRREDKPRREPGPLSIYFTAMPTLGYQKLEANPADNVIVESFAKLSNFSSKRLGIRAEIGVEYKLTPRVKAFGGVLYYQRKQTISYTERVTTGVKETVSGDTLTLDPQFAVEDRSFEYELKNVGVQLGLNYTLWKKKFLHVAGTGIEFHKALNKLPEDQRALGFTAHPSTYVFYNLYYRVQYPAEGRLKAIFQPTFNYSLFLNRDMNAPFYVKPYGLGLNLGVTYSF
jgi:hypothetical protein